MPQKSRGEKHERLNVLLGTWDTTITMLNSDGSDGEVSKATDIYSWSPNGFFLLHDVDATMGGERFQSLEIIAVDKDGRYATRSYDGDGSINDFIAELDGKDWRIKGELQRFSGSFSDDARNLRRPVGSAGEKGWVVALDEGDSQKEGKLAELMRFILHGA